MMRFNKQVFCTILFAFFLGLGILQAQEKKMVNADGDVIIVLPDGKWKYQDKQKEKRRVNKNSPLPKDLVLISMSKPQNGKEKKPTTTPSKKGDKPTTVKQGKQKSTAVKPTVRSSKNRKKKATVYPVPKRARKIKSPVVKEFSCEYSMKEKDEFTQKLKVATKPQPFFTYTQDKLKKFMRENDYLTCTGSLSRVLGMTILNIKFEIESIVAQQEYGEIETGTQILVKLLNGKTVKLTCQEGDSGTVDEINGKTVYRTYFTVDKNDAKELSKSEVVKVRMLWSTGYEDYEVNELDFFINQLNCLDQVTQ